MIKENNEEYVVEFSVTVIDPTYNELLSDPEAPQHNDVTRELTEKVRVKRETTDKGNVSILIIISILIESILLYENIINR